ALPRLRGVREERGQAPELLAAPRRERVAMTLGALDLDAQEQPRRGCRQIFRFVLIGDVERPWAARRKDSAGHLIVADIVAQLLAQPSLEADAHAGVLRAGRRVWQ